jgi:hypothetical protein
MKEYYYYLRDEDNHPRITVCLIEDSGFHRGISLCSFDEKEIDKGYGRRKARSRALHAYHTRTDSMPVESPKAMDVIMTTPFKRRMELFGSSFGNGGFKSQHLVKLTDFERKLIG